jgi:acetyl/propionyl-CoA carboxylase alpha subunit
MQLLVAQGHSLISAGLKTEQISVTEPPSLHSVQLRVTAENVDSDWSLSIGSVRSFQFPSGNGVRVDTHLISGYNSTIGTDFDSLLVKLIVTASSWEAVVQKARRALEDTYVVGVATNIGILKGIVSHPDFIAGNYDTRWLETNQKDLIELGHNVSPAKSKSPSLPRSPSPSAVSAGAGGGVILRRGDAWSFELSQNQDKSQFRSPGHLKLARVLRNDFPAYLSAEIEFMQPAAAASPIPMSIPYTLTLKSTIASSSAVGASHRRGNPHDPSHITIPFSGKLVEFCVQEGDVIKEGDVVCIVKQMKMELEVRAKSGGTVTWVLDLAVGEDVADGTLACSLKLDGSDRAAKL